MRRSAILILPLQLVFPAITNICWQWKTDRKYNKNKKFLFYKTGHFFSRFSTCPMTRSLPTSTQRTGDNLIKLFSSVIYEFS